MRPNIIIPNHVCTETGGGGEFSQQVCLEDFILSINTSQWAIGLLSLQTITILTIIFLKTVHIAYDL